MIGKTFLPAVIPQRPQVQARFTGFSGPRMPGGADEPRALPAPGGATLARWTGAGPARAGGFTGDEFIRKFLATMEHAGELLGKAAARHLERVVDRLSPAGKSGSAAKPAGPGLVGRTLNGLKQRLDAPVQSDFPGLRAIHTAGKAVGMAGGAMMTGGAAMAAMGGVVGPAVGGVLVLAGAAAKAIGAAMQAVAKLVEYADKVRQQQRQFAYASPSLARNYAESDVRAMLRDMRHGEAIAASNKRLNESLDKLADNLTPLQTTIDDLKNNVLGAIVEKLNAMIAWLAEKWPAFKKWMDQNKVTMTPWQNRFQELANQGDKNERLKQGLQRRVAQGGAR